MVIIFVHLQNWTKLKSKETGHNFQKFGAATTKFYLKLINFLPPEMAVTYIAFISVDLNDFG